MAFIILCVLHLSVPVFWGQKSVLGVIPSWGSNLCLLIRIGWLNSEFQRSDMPVNSTQHWWQEIKQPRVFTMISDLPTEWFPNHLKSIFTIYIISVFFKRAIVYTVTIKILGICILLTFKYILPDITESTYFH